MTRPHWLFLTSAAAAAVADANTPRWRGSLKGEQDEQLLQLFQEVDLDANGRIDKAELQVLRAVDRAAHALSHCGHESCAKADVNRCDGCAQQFWLQQVYVFTPE